MTFDEILAEVEYNGFNVTFSGGDPLYQIDDLIELARIIKSRGYNIWCYTGYLYEQVAESDRLSRILPLIDVLVDGPFIEAQRDTDLLFRGSPNQRLVDTKCSQPGKIVEYEADLAIPE